MAKPKKGRIPTSIGIFFIVLFTAGLVFIAVQGGETPKSRMEPSGVFITE